jgi:membrane-associated phospholipid phosphatase
MACLLAIGWADIPLMHFFAGGAARWSFMGENFNSPVLIGLITLVIAPLLLLRLTRGTLSDFLETVIVAGCAALASFTVNDFVLKRLFGRDTLLHYLTDPATAGFHLFHGGFYSSFPSGHSVMAATGLFVFARVYPRWLPYILCLLAVMALLLLVGNWHFLSDILAGMFLGALAGSLAGELARSHFARRHSASRS